MNTATVSRKRQLEKTIEDLDDHLALEKAIKRNAGKPLNPWREVANELGISAPTRKR